MFGLFPFRLRFVITVSAFNLKDGAELVEEFERAVLEDGFSGPGLGLRKKFGRSDGHLVTKEREFANLHFYYY